MDDWLAPSVIIGLLGAGGLYLGHIFTRRNSRDTLLLASRDDHIADLREDLRETRARLDKIAATVEEQGQQIQDLKVREWGLRRYIHRLIDKIRDLGHEPPDPPPNLNI